MILLPLPVINCAERAGLDEHGPVQYTTSLSAGLHQFVLEVFNHGGGSESTSVFLDIFEVFTGVSVTFAHDPAGPCNADCRVCNSHGLAYCEVCYGPGPYLGVCISPLVVPSPPPLFLPLRPVPPPPSISLPQSSSPPPPSLRPPPPLRPLPNGLLPGLLLQARLTS